MTVVIDRVNRPAPASREGPVSAADKARAKGDAKGGLEAAVCRAGYIPVLADDSYWRPGSQYRCRLLGY